jgi:hypothetical protein
VATAGRIVGGSLGEADAAASSLPAALLRQVYGEAFSTTALVLAVITLIAAVIAIAFVRRHEVRTEEAEEDGILALAESKRLG